MSTANRNNAADGDTHHLCGICGNDSKKRCGQCRESTDRACQEKDSKQHKKSPTCTRCLEPITSDACCIPHPEHLLEGIQKSVGGWNCTIKLDLKCKACQQTFSKSKKGDEADFTFNPPNARWCYRGPHTSTPIEEGDERRIGRDITTIKISKDDTTSQVQQKIDQLESTGVRILVIRAADDSSYHQHVKPKLDISLPKLEEITLLNVCFQKIVLNAQKTPSLRTIEHQNIPDECSIEMKCPKLEEFDGRHFYGDCKWVQEMLDAATQLRIYQSYKLSVREIQFRSSRELKEVHLHRSDGCRFVSISGPKLEHVRLQALYDLDRLAFPSAPTEEDIELDPPSKFPVDTTNSCLSDQVLRMLKNHPRVQWQSEEDYNEHEAYIKVVLQNIGVNYHRR